VSSFQSAACGCKLSVLKLHFHESCAEAVCFCCSRNETSSFRSGPNALTMAIPIPSARIGADQLIDQDQSAGGANAAGGGVVERFPGR